MVEGGEELVFDRNRRGHPEIISENVKNIISNDFEAFPGSLGVVAGDP